VWKNMKILITGGCGFIARTLFIELIKTGNQVSLLDKKISPFDNTNTVHYIQTDVCDQNMMQYIFENYQFDGVIHLAAISRVVDAENNPQECERTNIGGIYSLLNAIEKSQQKPWLIFGSSREVYGEQLCLPIKENARLLPVNIYGETKVEGERLFSEFAKNYHLNCAIIRFSNVYVNRFDIFDRVIPKFIRTVVAGKTLTIEGGDQ
ncbi:NAD-dependent epimerase/dehydratase, partial [Candidatus Magnetomorum sp. HK-1]